MASASGLDSWQSLFETCQRLDHELTSKLAIQQTTYSKTQFRNDVQESMGRLSLAVLSLRQKLDRNESLTVGEKRRREAAVSALEGREKQLKMSVQGSFINTRKTDEDERRRQLFDSNIIDLGVEDSWTNSENDALLPHGHSDLKTYHQSRETALADQDRYLHTLHTYLFSRKSYRYQL